MTSLRGGETRIRILQAALDCFSADGYAAASVEDICRAAGVSKGAFYHHFESKQALFLTLLDDWLRMLEVDMEAMKRSTIPETLIQMTSVLPGVFRSARNRLVMWLEFWLQASRNRTVWKATIAPYHHYRDLFATLVKQGIDEGSLGDVDPQVVAQAILSLAVGLFLQGVLDPKGADWSMVSEQSVRLLLNGIRKTS
jgi:AcrR family transcriptional regulator